MNSNQPSRNPFPHLNTTADARGYMDSIRANLSFSWNSVEHVLKTLEDKMNQIESLRANLDERNSRITQLEGMLTDIQSQNQEKDRLIRLRDHFIQRQASTNQEKESTIQLLTSWNKEMQTKIASYEESGGLLLKENAGLKAKLSRAEEQNHAVIQGPKLTGEQQKILEDAINRELTQRSSLVNAKVKEVVMQYQRRVSELEEQLRLLRTKTGIDYNIDPSASGHLIENTPCDETNPNTDSNPPENAMITLPNLDNDNPHHQQPSGPSHTPGYSSTSGNHNTASYSTQPPQS